MFSFAPTSRAGRKIYLSIWDVFWAVVSPLVALYVRDSDVFFQHADWNVVGQYWMMSAAFALLAFFAFRLQDGMTRNFSFQEAIDIAEAVLFAQLMTCAVLFTWSRLDGIPRSAPLIHGLLLGAGLITARLIVRIASGADQSVPEYQDRHERMIIIGSNRMAAAFIQLLRSYAPQQEPVIAVLDEATSMIGRALAGVQVVGSADELDSIIKEFAIHGVKTNRVVIAGEPNLLRPAVLEEVDRICATHQITLSFLPQMMGLTERKLASARQPLLPVTASVPVRSYFFIKRWIDVLGSLALIILFSPILVIAAVLVRLDVGSPVVFWQERVGWKRRSFLIYKFRTLHAPFDSEGTPTQEGRRPSAIGRFLRTTRIDELPQLFNVLLGDMSLVGPRPLLPQDQPSESSLRLAVRPGITGWAQINGAKLVSKEDKEKFDEWYVQNASLLVDLRIALRTIVVLMKTRMSSTEATADAEQVRGKDIELNQARPS